MQIFFNDLSCGDSSISLTDNFSKVKMFFSLIAKLKDYGISSITIDKKFDGMALCGLGMADCHSADSLNFDQRNLLLQLRNH